MYELPDLTFRQAMDNIKKTKFAPYMHIQDISVSEKLR
jgi:hypothetical protein